MVEGHTDNVPINKADGVVDNWDLSVKRATSVVRILQNDYGVDPTKLVAAGRSFYMPIADNDSSVSRAVNRRTRIIVLPKLDQFTKLILLLFQHLFQYRHHSYFHDHPLN